MKFNISYPTNGTHLTIKLDLKTEQRLYGKKLLDIIDGGLIKSEWNGAKFQLTGGCDVQGFPMIRTLLTDKRKRALLKKGDKGFMPKNRKGLKKRKTIRGSIIAQDIAMVCASLIEDNGVVIPTLTDNIVPLTHWPKRFRKLKERAGYDRDDDVTPEEVKSTIRNAILEVNGGDVKKLPKLKISRYPTEIQIKRKEIAKKQREARKIKSEQAKIEFEQKYPEWMKSFKQTA